MFGFSDWLHVTCDLLRMGDVAACTALLAGVGGSMVATVALLDTEVTVEEALSYAGVLYELGQRTEAAEVAREAVLGAFRPTSYS
jgi:hypothetical protein